MTENYIKETASKEERRKIAGYGVAGTVMGGVVGFGGIIPSGFFDFFGAIQQQLGELGAFVPLIGFALVIGLIVLVASWI